MVETGKQSFGSGKGEDSLGKRREPPKARAWMANGNRSGVRKILVRVTGVAETETSVPVAGLNSSLSILSHGRRGGDASHALGALLVMLDDDGVQGEHPDHVTETTLSDGDDTKVGTKMTTIIFCCRIEGANVPSCMICESFASLFWIVVKFCTHDPVTNAHQHPLDRSCSRVLRSCSVSKVARHGTRHVTGTVATATGVAARVSVSTPSGLSCKGRAECSNNLGVRQRRDCCPRHLGAC